MRVLLGPVVGLVYLSLAASPVLAEGPHALKAGPFGFTKCLSREVSKAELKQIETKIADVNKRTVKTTTAVSIPVYVHVIQSSEGENTTTDAQIEAQINLLNRTYGGKFVFTLMNVDVTVNDDWFNLVADSQDEYDMKSALYAGDSTALNIYLTTIDEDLLGYATFPWDYEDDPVSDGVVVQFATLPGGDAVPYDRGVTTVHEVGHWLGLFHTFQDTSVENNGCKGRGDSVSDTPAEKVPHYRCKNTDSCPTQKGRDPIRNFMNYTPDACQRSFTKRQFSRMSSMYRAYRAPF